MRADPIAVDAGAPLIDVVRQMQSAGIGIAPVLSGGQLVGLLTFENLGEFLAIRGGVG